MSRHRFRFAPAYRAPALLLGITPRTAWVDVAEERLHVRYGAWSLDTPLTNVSACRLTDGYTWFKTAGPPHLSFADRGVSFATCSGPGLCVSFAEPVAAIEPTGRLRHPAATLTVEDLHALAADLGQPVIEEDDT